jgi:hypothetical protein
MIRCKPVIRHCVVTAKVAPKVLQRKGVPAMLDATHR